MIWLILIAQLVLLGGAGYLIYVRERKYMEWMELLLRFIKPDTFIKQKGTDEAVKAIQGKLWEIQKKEAEEQHKKEVQMINRLS